MKPAPVKPRLRTIPQRLSHAAQVAPAVAMPRKKKLTAKQRAQRKYARAMQTVRGRAKKRKGGRGRIKHRTTAAKLRRKHGLKHPRKKKS